MCPVVPCSYRGTLLARQLGVYSLRFRDLTGQFKEKSPVIAGALP